MEEWSLEIDISERSLPVFEALASKVRLDVIHLLARRSMNVKELAQTLGLSSAIMTMHIRKLEGANIIRTELRPGKGGRQKMCFLNAHKIEILFPDLTRDTRKYHQTDVPVGHYSDFDVKPTCGLATTDKVIGTFDDPRCFMLPERVDAKILWLGQGYLEYKVPNYLLRSEIPEELEISMELSSEAPFSNSNWPSDISFFFNGVYLGKWTSPGDFGGYRGRYTPDWWDININQYGLMKILRVKKDGCFLDGEKISDVTLDQVDVEKQQWTFRIAVLEDAEHIGGLTLFGSNFGNYDQDLRFRLYYTKRN
jgi:predicted transcriptional regulator